MIIFVPRCFVDTLGTAKTRPWSVQEGKTKTLARVTAEVPWCASKKENLALALLELLVGESAVPLRAFQGCTPMCASTTTGLKPPWEATLKTLKKRLKPLMRLLL